MCPPCTPGTLDPAHLHMPLVPRCCRADGLGWLLLAWPALGGIVFQLTLLHLPLALLPTRYQDGISAPAAVKLQASMLLLLLFSPARPVAALGLSLVCVCVCCKVGALVLG